MAGKFDDNVYQSIQEETEYSTGYILIALEAKKL
jgi:hypothetical protein